MRKPADLIVELPQRHVRDEISKSKRPSRDRHKVENCPPEPRVMSCPACDKSSCLGSTGESTRLNRRLQQGSEEKGQDHVMGIVYLVVLAYALHARIYFMSTEFAFLSFYRVALF